MFGRVVDGEPIPDLKADFLAVALIKDLRRCVFQDFHNQMDGLGLTILHGQTEQRLGKSKADRLVVGKVKCWAGFGLYRAENVGGPAAFVLAVLASLPARFSSAGGSNVSMQRTGFSSR